MQYVIREISIRNRESRRLILSSATAPINIPAPHPLFRSVCTERVHPPPERVPHHRIRVPAAIDQPPVIQGQRGGPMPRNLDASQPSS